MDEMKLHEACDFEPTTAHEAYLQQEVLRLRSAMQEAADQIRRCDYTPARSTLLVALGVLHNAADKGRA